MTSACLADGQQLTDAYDSAWRLYRAVALAPLPANLIAGRPADLPANATFRIRVIGQLLLEPTIGLFQK
jgi:hypothetical protein